MERLLKRVMAENNCIPESLERRKEYLAKRRGFREALQRSAEVQGDGGDAPALDRPRMEAKMARLREMLAAFDSAAVKGKSPRRSSTSR